MRQKQLELFNSASLKPYYKQLIRFSLLHEDASVANLLDDNYLRLIGIEEETARKAALKFVIENSDSLLHIKKDSVKTLCEKPIDRWTTVEVLIWLQLISMDQYKEQFRKQQVAGTDLLQLSDVSLVQLGIRPLGHRKKILRRIRFHSSILL